MDKEKLKEILIDQREYFLSKKNLVNREVNMNSYLKSRQIVLITGVRRCGKSSMLYLIKNMLNIEDKNVCYFNFDDERITNFEPEDFNKIYSLQLELYNSDPARIIIFFDEVQNAKGFEKFLNRMHEKGIKIYVTGSNANLLSSEIATVLTGRNLTLELYPFSFREYLSYNHIDFKEKNMTTEKKAIILSKFNDYLKYGGFPLMVIEKNPELIKSYYSDILYRDIIVRWKLTNVEEIKAMSSFIASNISKVIPYSSIQEVTNIKSLSSIKNYIHYLENAFLFFQLKKFDYSIKKQILNPKKMYIIDSAFESQIAFKFSDNHGRIIENTVFLHLKRNKYEIFYHKGKKECDFIINENNKVTKVIQVTSNLGSDKTKNREIEGLMEALIAYNLKEGLILTDYEDDEFLIDSKKIIVKPVWKWLLEI